MADRKPPILVDELTYELVEDTPLGEADLVVRTERWTNPSGTVYRSVAYGRTATTAISPSVALLYVPNGTTVAAQQPAEAKE